jgi:hypothetical protein
MGDIKEVNFRPLNENIPRMLRARADALEDEGLPMTVVLVEYYGNGVTEVFGFGGDLTAGQAYMTLDQGKRKLLDMGV